MQTSYIIFKHPVLTTTTWQYTARQVCVHTRLLAGLIACHTDTCQSDYLGVVAALLECKNEHWLSLLLPWVLFTSCSGFVTLYRWRFTLAPVKEEVLHLCRLCTYAKQDEQTCLTLFTPCSCHCSAKNHTIAE